VESVLRIRVFMLFLSVHIGLPEISGCSFPLPFETSAVDRKPLNQLKLQVNPYLAIFTTLSFSVHIIGV
jgi:hypothetical protein